MKYTNQKNRSDLVTDDEHAEEQQGSKLQFNEPKLKFIEPKLTAKGDLREITGFFGGFSP